MRRLIAAVVCTLLGLSAGLGGSASAQDYPTRPVRVVIAFSPSGAIDILGRFIADKLSQMWGQSVIVENRPGGSGNIGAAAAAAAQPDGYTLHFGAQTLAVNVTLSPATAFDPVASFDPIILVATSQEVFQVSAVTPYKSIQEVIDYAKANPGKLNYASSGNGSTIHLSGELFKAMTGTEMNHIPYRGSAPAVNDLVGGQVDLMFDNATSIIGQVRGNTVTSLGVTSLKRSPLLPEIPTVADTVAGFDTASWFGVGVRAGVSEEIIAKIEQAVKTVAQEAVVKERMASVIADPVVSDRKTFNEFIVAERQKWGTLIKKLNLRVE